MSKKKKSVIVAGAVTIAVTLLSFFGVPAPVVNLVASIGQTVASVLDQTEEVQAPEVQE